MVHDADAAPPVPAEQVVPVDDDWRGSGDADHRTERFFLDRDQVERVDVVEAGQPVGVAWSATPRPVPSRRPRPMRHGDREADPLFIINRDDRLIYNDHRYPWGLVCRVNDNRDGSAGSGVLVGPRHVLTASHAIDWANDDLDVTVEVHAFDLTSRAWSYATQAGTYTRVPENADSDLIDEDYAVLVLERRLGDEFGWMGVRTYNSTWDEDELWYSIGYAGDLGFSRRPQWQRRFYLDEDALDYGPGRAMDTNADMVKGQSGSPVFAFWERGPYVVAVISAEVAGDNYCAGGNAMTSLVNGVRKKFP